MKKSVYIGSFLGMIVLCVVFLFQGSIQAQAQYQGDAAFTAVPPGSKQPETPIAVLMNTLHNPQFRESLRRENERFKLLTLGVLPGHGLSNQQREYELIEAFSKNVSDIVITNIRDQLKERAQEALEGSAFDRILQLAEHAKDITKNLRISEGERSIAMNVEPHPLEPKLEIQNLVIDSIHLAYNTQDQAPSLFLEQGLTPNVKSQVHYDMLLQKIDGALKTKINDSMNFHIINSNNLNRVGEKSVIFGISIKLH